MPESNKREGRGLTAPPDFDSVLANGLFARIIDFNAVEPQSVDPSDFWIPSYGDPVEVHIENDSSLPGGFTGTITSLPERLHKLTTLDTFTLTQKRERLVSMRRFYFEATAVVSAGEAGGLMKLELSGESNGSVKTRKSTRGKVLFKGNFTITRSNLEMQF